MNDTTACRMNPAARAPARIITDVIQPPEKYWLMSAAMCIVSAVVVSVLWLVRKLWDGGW